MNKYEYRGEQTVKRQVKNTISAKDFLKMGSKYRDVKLMMTGARKYTSDPREIEMLEKYYYLIANTDYLREDVYAFLVDEKSYKEVVEEYGVHENYIRNIIYKEVNRLYEDITEDPYAFVRYKDYRDQFENPEEVVEILNQRLEQIISNLTVRRTNDMLDYLVVNIEQYSEQYSEFEGEVDTETLDDMLTRLQYLSQPYLEKLFGMMDKRLLGYVVYLLSTNNRNLSKRDVNKKEEICDMLFIPKR